MPCRSGVDADGVTVVDAQRLFTTTPAAGEYTNITPTADGKITVSVAPTRSPDIQLSWLMIAKTS